MGLRGPVAGIQPFAEISRRATTVVYKGYDSSLDRFVLLKVLRPEYAVHEDIALRFQSEARLLAKVSHPNVVAVYAYGEDDGIAYMTTEFVDGQTLDELLQGGPLPPALAAAIMLRVARGLSASHGEGVLHRDLKPDNILLSDKGQVKLTDFGLAVSEEARGDRPAIAGTLSYMAPEIVGGEPPTPSSDLFAAGSVLFELLTARKAFPGDSDSEVLDGVLNKSPLHGVESYSDAPPALLVICNRLLQKDPARRMPSADDLADALETWLTDAGASVAESDIATYLENPDGWDAALQEIPSATHAPEAPVPPSDDPRPPASKYVVWTAAAAVAVIALALWMMRPPDGLPDGDAGADSTVTQTSTAERTPSLNEDDTSDAAPGSPSTDPDPARVGNTVPIESEAGREGSEETVAENSSALDSLRSPIVADTTEGVLAGSGRLAVAFSPWATLWIGGDSVTTTSVDTVELPVGDHQVTLRNPDFPELRRQIRISPDKMSRLEVSLWATVARLSLQVVPWAAVEIDGAVVDTIPPQTRPLILEPGAHSLRLLHPDFGEIQRDIVLQAGEHRELAYNMRDASRR